ncbi:MULTISPECIES: OFA family MFS transporter [unclassified Streptomyces]|uniref:OFA family MFS transporter n=1 Tax=unclassified Streptomyces TaxID=2593676 RepID=UPI002255A189|nr:MULTISPECIES: OFA family MFS transporter [unclassified Streptomyces]MCX5440714.1 OFA family MFS transporter [Streptomyces sp. NBC_00063]WSE18194.1 OFA family MFS transporter [Streptomyces sp. NBC_01397]WUB92915.1 OFA family MFS transporter [Streptomyces sp. NBC_00569]
MTATDLPISVPYREVTDANGRVFRVGETDIDIMGRKRRWMVILPWVGMMGISSAEYAFASAEDTLHTAHDWNSAHIFWMMTVWVFFQAAVAFPAGRLRESGRLPARWAMLIGASGTLLGYLSLAFAPHVVFAYIGFSVFSGMGAGMVYATCVNMVGKWYPERRGGKTGFVNGGFAYGSVPFVFLFTGFMNLTNFRWVLVSVGVLLATMVAVAGSFFKDPPKNWWPANIDPLNPPKDPRARRSLLKNPPAVKQYTPLEAWRTGRVALMWFCLACTSGVNIFGIAFQVDIGNEAGFAGGIVATAMSLKAIVNGTGRGVIGWLSDRYGRKQCLLAVCLILGLAQFGIIWSAETKVLPLFLVFSAISGFGGGAIFPMFAALTADYFGENNNASNYGMVYSSKLVSGLGAGMGSVVVGAWGHSGAFILAGCISIFAGFVALFLSPPGRRTSRGIRPNPQPLGEEMA